MIKVTSLNKFYNKGKSNEIHVIDNTSMVLPDKGFVTFLGQSGSGKTTLLNTIGGLDNAKGIIEYDDLEIKNYDVKKIDKYRSKNIGYVFQTYNLLNGLSVAENIKVSLELIGITDPEEIEKRTNFSLDAVNMLKYKRRTAGALSGGQQQRISIARALAKNSKIIIADEPTGNLDSQNGIEVMNILKTLSVDVLVLLVTHDEEFAKFYSEQIIELSDGKLVSNNENSALTGNIDTKDERIIYLGDLDKKTKDLDENYSIEYYTEDGIEIPDLDLKFIYNKGNLYIDSNEPIKLVSKDEDVTLSPLKYVGYDKKDEEEFSFDMSHFSDETKKGISFSLMGSNLKNSFLDFFRVKKGTKFLNFCMVLLGIVECIMIISYAFTSNYSEESLSYVDEGYSLNECTTQNETSIQRDLGEYFNTNTVNDVLQKYSMSIYLSSEGYTLTTSNDYFEEAASYTSLSSYILPSNKIENDLLMGRLPNGNFEMVLDKSLLSSLNEDRIDTKYSIGSLMNKKVSVNGIFFTVVGISDTKSTVSYVSSYMIGQIPLYSSSYYSFNTYSENSFGYDLVLGSGFTKDASEEKQILVNLEQLGKLTQDITDTYVPGYYPISEIVDGELVYTNYKIVGYYQSVDYSCFITNDNVESLDSKKDMSLFHFYTNNEKSIYYLDVSLEEGVYPLGGNDIVVSSLVKSNGYSLGDKVSHVNSYDWVTGEENSTDYTIVGFSDELSYADVIVTGNALYEAFDGTIDVSTVFLTDDLDNLQLKFDDLGLTVLDNKTAVSDQALEEHQKTTRIFQIIALVTLAITLIFTYLVMRTRMLNRIYDIGVYRALGASKSKIYGLFTYDIVILTLFTNMLGYLLVYIVYKNAISSFGDILSLITEIDVSNSLLLLGIPIIFILNIIFGLLPVFMLLKKSPAKILAKYDI